jgi:hypothetical protein
MGAGWLYTYESSNILTDLLLMAASCSLIWSVRIPLMQRLRVLLVFSVGLLLVMISILRVLSTQGSSLIRDFALWANLEVLFAVIVAVTPTVYALIRNTQADMSQFEAHTEMRSLSKAQAHGVEDNPTNASDASHGVDTSSMTFEELMRASRIPKPSGTEA